MKSKVFALAISTLFLSACVTNNQSPDTSMLEYTMEEYAKCIRTAAISMSGLTETPRDIALASQGVCVTKYNEYEAASRDFYMASVSPYKRPEAAEWGTSGALKFKDQMSEMAASFVINSRMERKGFVPASN